MAEEVASTFERVFFSRPSDLCPGRREFLLSQHLLLFWAGGKRRGYALPSSQPN